MLIGDVEVNPGSPKKTKNASQSVAGTPVAYLPIIIPNYLKFSVSQIYLKTYLDFNTPLYDDNLEISG